MVTAEEMEPAGHVHVNAGRLWGGGVATAIVAALAVLAGVFIALADVIAAAAPFTQPAPLASKIFTAIINIVVGVAVISLLSGVGRVAIRPAALPTIPTGRSPRADLPELTAGIPLYPAFTPGQALPAPPVPARAGRGPRP
jgi:hypothetical protein